MNIQTIIDTVCNYRGINPEKLAANTKKRDICEIRQIVHYLCHVYQLGNYRAIGEHVGGLDHATVIHSCKTISNMIETDASIRNEIKQIRTILDERKSNKYESIMVTINALDDTIVQLKSQLTKLSIQQ